MIISKVYIIQELKELEEQLKKSKWKSKSKSIGSCKVKADKNGELGFFILHEKNLNLKTKFNRLAAASLIFSLTKGESIDG